MTEPDRCPECGYTFEDTQLHCDHVLCANYPFFPHEVGVEKHNQWVDKVKSDVEVEPLREFLDKLKE